VVTARYAIVALLATLLACRTLRTGSELGEIRDARKVEVARADAERVTDPAHAFEIAWIEGNDRSLARRILDKGLAAKPGDPGLLLRRAVLSMVELSDGHALEDLLAIVRGQPASPECEIALHLIHESLAKDVTRRAEILDAIRSSGVLRDRSTSSVRVVLATAIAASLDSVDRKEPDMQADIARGGWLMAWRAIGPLAPRTPSSFAPTEEEQKGVDKGPLRAFRGMKPLLRSVPSIRTAVSPVAGDQAGLYVMETFVELGEDAKNKAAVLESHLRDPSRIWIDGVKVHEATGLGPHAPAYQRLTLELKPGWHRISVAILTVPSSRPSLSLLAEDGSPLVIQARPTPSSPPASSPPSVVDRTSPGAAMIERLVRDPERTLFGRILGTHIALSVYAEDLDRARDLMGPAVVHAAQSAAILAEDARLMSHGLPQSIVQSRIREALARDETNPSILLSLARTIIDDQPDLALPLIDRAEQASPAAAEPHALRARVYNGRGWNAEAASCLQSALEKRESEATLHEAAALHRTLLRVSEARAFEERAAAVSEPSQAGETLANLSLSAGDVDRAIEQLVEASRWGDRVVHLSRAAEIQLGRGNLDGAIEQARAVLAEDPLQASALRTLAVSLEGKGDKAGALAALDRLRVVGASDTRLEMMRARLLGQELGTPREGTELGKLLAVDPRRLVETSEDLAFKWARYKSVRLLDRIVDWIQPDGHSLSIRHAVTRLQTKEATDQAGELRLPGEAIPLQLRTIKSDGRIIDVDRHPGKDDLSFSALAPGDAVEKEWVTLDSPATPWGGYVRRFFFQGAAPSLRTELVIVVPHGTPVWSQGYHGAPKPRQLTEDGNDVYLWTRIDAAAVDPEPNSVSHEEYLPFVVVAVGIDEATAQRANGIAFENIAPTTWDVRQKALELVRGTTEDKQRVEAIYDFVQHEIGHGRGRDPAMVLATRRGDRTGLFLAMLRAAGVKADAVLARPGAAPKVEPTYPNPARFAVELVRIQLGKNKTVWARFDSEHPWIGKATPDLRGGDYILPERFDQLQPIAFKDDEVDTWTLSSAVELAVDAQGTASGTLSLTLPGAYGSDLREFLKSARKDDIERILQGWVAEVLPGAKLERYDSEGAKNGLAPLKLITSIVVPHFMVAEGNHLIAEQFFNAPIASRMLGFPSLATYLRVPNRSTPMYLIELGEQMAVSITLPSGSGNPVEAPKSFKRSASYGRFVQEFTWDVARHNAKLVTEQMVPALRLPKSDFAKFRDGAQEILQATRNRLIVPLNASTADAR
jgi:tetratricopeptide (TPR) repeat protein